MLCRIAHILLLLIAPLAAIADVLPVDVDVDADSVPIGPHFEICEDEARQLTVEDVWANPSACLFESASGQTDFRGFGSGRVWLRFALRNPSGEPLERIVALDQPFALITELHALGEDGSFATRRRGWLSETRDATRIPAFSIVLAPRTTQTFYLSTETDGPGVLDLTVSEPTAFLRQEVAIQAGYDIYILFAVVLGLFNLANYFIHRSRQHLYIGPFAVSYALLHYVASGSAAIHLSPAAVPLCRFLLPLAGACLVIFGVQFTRTFLSTATIIPRLDLFLRSLLIGGGVVLVLTPLQPALAMPIAGILWALALPLHATIAGYAAFQGQRAAWIYLAGTVLFSAVASVSVLLVWGVLDPTLGMVAVSGSGYLVIVVSTTLAVATDMRNKLQEADVLAQRFEQVRGELTHLGRRATAGEMVASIAHEVNQPLASILSRAQGGLRFLNRESPALNQVRTALEQIVADDRRAALVVQRLREMLRPRDEKREPLDVNEIVREVGEILRRDLAQAATTLALKLQPELPHVLADRVQLQQVLLNLLTNALNALERTERQDRLVTIVTRTTGRDEVTIEVRDSGPGISPEVRETLFDAFVTTKEGGLGMGLAISRTIMEGHGGNIEVGNAEEGGAIVSIVLPTSLS